MFKKQPIDNTVVDYRRCFSTDAGKRVLSNMLLEAKFFDFTTTPEEQAVENFVKVILTKCGSYHADNMQEYINNLMAMRMQ